ncbi:hypothetical protein OOZ54_12655 [Rhodopseudomonas palustris]|uniref:hypothetical protein n=1 Tax=Rhodopseudomonas palustris TaxID=1076 RepID=UPI0022F1329F|nr:hypothetical protein [Rhodopseudomonas palustris]WBU27545.1 hypothetical protein OOZ54_12655 [Rhodopseudomonas palustris]
MAEPRMMSQEEMAAAFDEWMRQYTEDPAAFEAEFQTVQRFMADKADGREPDYGQSCAALMFKLSDALLQAAG